LLSAIDPENAPAPVIFGLAGHTLTTVERDFFKAANPLGFILFGRNIQDPDQVRAMVKSLKDCLGRDAPILIDQEGGRVRRLKPPHWVESPAAASFGATYEADPAKAERDLAQAVASMAKELTDLGIQVDCAPVLDLLHSETHAAIGDRAFSADPATVSALGRIACHSFIDNGIVPVMKHLPGQGRAASDSHHDLPVVGATLDELAASDFLPFRDMLTQAFSEALWGMVAHVIYDKIDASLPASCSRKVVHDVIRKAIGFQGLLLSDDIDMGALAFIGDAGRRAEQALRAGCDIVLQCSGMMEDMKKVEARKLKMTAQAVARYNRTVEYFA
jgi:beta-N-acetylhexosaminidase